MEFWLSHNNGAERLQLPVAPSEFQISQGNLNTTVNIINLGEINLIGKGRLASITIASFFPSQEYNFCQYTGFAKPYECVQRIDRWRKSGSPIRLMITQTSINLAATIENFDYGEQDGTGDVYFSLELKEYRFVGITQATSSSANSRSISKAIPKTYTVKPGDTLYLIAKRLTGDGANYTKIAAKNSIKNPNMIIVGQKLVI